MKSKRALLGSTAVAERFREAILEAVRELGTEKTIREVYRTAAREGGADAQPVPSDSELLDLVAGMLRQGRSQRAISAAVRSRFADTGVSREHVDRRTSVYVELASSRLSTRSRKRAA